MAALGPRGKRKVLPAVPHKPEKLHGGRFPEQPTTPHPPPRQEAQAGLPRPNSYRFQLVAPYAC